MKVNFLHRLLRMFFQPSREWSVIRAEEQSSGKIFVNFLIVSFFIFLFRWIGGLFLHERLFWNFLESFLFTLICLGSSLSIGLFLIPCSKFARFPVNDSHAMKLSFYSSLPLGFWSFIQLVPSHTLRVFFLLIAMGHCSVFLFLGLPKMFGTEPLYTLSLSLLLSGAWVLTMVLMSQVFLGMAFAL